MINYREILRLKSQDYSQRQIAASVHSSRNTIKEVFVAAKNAGIEWPLDDTYTNEVLSHILFPSKEQPGSDRVLPDFNYIHKELAKPGVNLTLLWTEYCEECNTNGTNPYMYSQFCDKYRDWARVTKATMRINHKPGDVMQVDWAGSTIEYQDSITGDIYEAYIFAAVLPCSCIAYAQACDDMQTNNWLDCHVNAFNYFGGVPRLIIPDNLKTGVTSNTRYETILNRSYNELADYYDTAIVPARVKHPQDKSLAEGTVKFVTTWIIAALRNRKFFSLEEVQKAVAEKLDELNRQSFKKREGCRLTAYSSEEQAYMKPLPFTPFEPAVWSTAKVPFDYLITAEKNKYSVPFDLIGEQVDIRQTSRTVEVFFHGSMVASHPKAMCPMRDPIVKPEHMPVEHRKYLRYNTDDFLAWANEIGVYTSKVVESFLFSGKEPEQGFKACASLTKLCDKYSHERVESACKKVLNLTTQPTIRTISTMLRNGQDKIITSEPLSNESIEKSGITRGASYFKRGGAQ